MIKNYFKIAYRNLVRNPGYSMINVAGLTLGMICCFLIALFAWDELSYDQFHKDKDRVFRIYDKRIAEGSEKFLAVVPPVFAPTLERDFPEIESTLRMIRFFNKPLIAVGDKQNFEERGIFAEPTFFEMFSIELEEGDKKTSLKDPNSIIISKSLATKYFGEQDPMGQNVTVSGTEYMVKGILANVPEHFHLEIPFLLSFETYKGWISKERMESWGWQQFYTYIKLNENARVENVSEKLPGFAEKYAYQYTKPSGFYYIPYLQNIQDIYLYSAGFDWDIVKKGNGNYVMALIATSLFILLIACINFINLSTAKSLQRAKEVGVRKVNGAMKSQLMLQFIGESVILTMISLIIAGVATELAIPALNDFTGKNISVSLISSPVLSLGLVIFSIFIGILAIRDIIKS